MVSYMRDPTVASGSFSLKVTIPLVPRGAWHWAAILIDINNEKVL